ncbi:hypothetical protein L1049_009634 [Liquidambar formosana]|uniref:Coatomer subunit zeta n=1 Tax=Liquidambar formosana TaxID=63359 RepID=A0AAP0N9X4_LIQFO
MNARFIYGRGVGDNSHILSITLRTSNDPRRVFEHINMESCPSIRNILLLDSEGKRVAVKYYSDDWPTHNAKEAFEKAVFTKTQKTNARTEGVRHPNNQNFSSQSNVPRCQICGRIGHTAVRCWFRYDYVYDVDENLPKAIATTTVLDTQGQDLNWYIDTRAKSRMTSDEAEIAMFENNIVVYKFVQDLHFFVTGGEEENELILATVLQGFFDAVGLLLRGNVDKKEALENLDLILLCLDEIVDGGIILETDANVIAGKVASHSMDAGAPLSEQTISQALATAREHLTRSLLK